MTFQTTNIEAHGDHYDPLITTFPGSYRSGSLYRRYFKRALESVITIAAAPIVLPLVLLLAAAVALDGYNPFFTQRRVGRDGRIFKIWKLRTMVPDAEGHLARYLVENPHARNEWDKNQKLKRDPRVTRLGRFLRKTSLDELPQLLNVLNGTMSLVGPRPIMVSQKEVYPGRAYYNLRPGITGFWQISERNDSTFVGRVTYDDEYDRSISFVTDFMVLCRTVAVVLRGTGY